MFFYDDCVEAFETLKKALSYAPIVQPPDWNLPFEIMCDASDYVVGAILGQRVYKKLNVIMPHIVLRGMLIMLIISWLNLYHLVSHTSKRKSFSMI